MCCRPLYYYCRLKNDCSVNCREVLDDIYRSAMKRQTGVSLKYMMDFGAFPLDRQLLMSAQFLQKVRIDP